MFAAASGDAAPGVVAPCGSVAGFGVVALGAVGGVASAGGRARVIIATATDSRTILEACWSPLSGDQC